MGFDITQYELEPTQSEGHPLPGEAATAGVSIRCEDKDWWFNRIECHGGTLEEAEALRDLVILGLQTLKGLGGLKDVGDGT